jgi:hypothetical protein
MAGRLRVVVVVAILLAASSGAMLPLPAWSASAHSRHPVLKFDAALQQAQLTIPVPACPVSNENCEWMLFVNEPLLSGKLVIGSVTGSSGSLTVNLPKFCGVIQADVLLGPAPWRFKFGHRRQINTCDAPTPPLVSSAVAPAAVSATTTSALRSTDPTGARTTAAELPFTGFDVQTLFVLGTSMMGLGAMLLSTIGFHRRMLRWATWWFLGL